jgi:cysteine-rich repeat protein
MGDMSKPWFLAFSWVLAASGACSSNQASHDAGKDVSTIVFDLDADDGPQPKKYDAVDESSGKAAICGDGIRDPGEACDDGNTISGDGCTEDCAWNELGWACTPGKPCVPICGDSLIRGQEVCADNNTLSGDGCSGDCMQVEPGWRCRAAGLPCLPICGDRMLVGTENCDDGNTLDGDGCGHTCLTETGWDCSTGACVRLPGDGGIAPGHFLYCGDGIVSGAEECDLGPANDDTQYGGCTTQCLAGPFCGDSLVNGSEECDLGAENRLGAGKGGCTLACTKPHYCGDDVVDPGEMCDLGEGNGVRVDPSGKPSADGVLVCDWSCNLIGIP